MKILVQALVAARGGSLTVLRDLVAAWPDEDELLISCWREEAAETLRETGHRVLRVKAGSTEQALIRMRFGQRATLARFCPDAVWSQAVWAGGLGAPQAVHYRDIGSFVDIHPSTFRQHAKAFRERRDLQRADLRIFNSATMRDAVSDRYPATTTLPHTVIHNGLNLAPFRAQSSRPASIAGRRMGHIVLLPQMDAAHKRNWLAADVVALLRDRYPDQAPVKLTVVGNGRYEDLRQRLADHGLADSATFTGYVSRERIADIYRSSDAVLMTARGESFGNPIVEAHAAGRPVVTPPLPVALELGGPLTNVAVADDGPSLTDALHRALTTTIDFEAARAAQEFAGAFRAEAASQKIRAALRSMVTTTDSSSAARRSRNGS